MRAISRPPAAPSGDSWLAKRSTIATGIVLCIWLAVVVVTTTRHEFWRDEVRALSLARAASSPLDLYQLVQDGHPPLWHLLLYLGTSVVDTTLVLPVTSIVVALAAVTLFMVAAPFSFWFRCLFIFSALPLYEYSVMARNYGISMLLLFTAAVLYRKRTTHRWWLAFALALLANTNVHSAMFACLAAAVWAWDMTFEQNERAATRGLTRYLPLGIVFAGVLACALFAMPRENTILTSVRQSVSVTGVTGVLRGAILRPDDTFAELLPAWLPSKAAVLLFYGAVLGLWTRPNLLLAALAAQTALGLFFRLAYPGWYRHQGLYLVFLVFLYWLFYESAGKRAWEGVRRVMFRGGLMAVLVLVVVDVTKAPRFVWADITGERSASRAFGEFLSESATHGDAVVVPEPDFLLESLPYYAGNPIYLPRERRFGKTVSWTTDSSSHLTLGELLTAARDVRARSGTEVLIVLGSMDPDLDGAGEKTYLYGTVFSWSAAEAREFRSSTTRVAEFSVPDGDEEYKVFALTR